VAAADLPAAVTALAARQSVLGFTSLTVEPDLTEVTLSGAGLRTDPAITPTFCAALTGAGVALGMVTIGMTCCRVVCPTPLAAAAGRALREAFEVTSPGGLPVTV
jgi:aspartate kinase